MNINRQNIKYIACRSISDNVTVSAYGFNASENRILCRPLSGGTSIGNFLNMYGTLGGLFRDDTDGTIVGLTCRHVCDKMVYTKVGGNVKDSVTLPAPYAPFNRDFVRTRFTSLSDRLCEDFILSRTVLYKDEYTDSFNKEYNNFLYDKTYRGIVYTLRTYERSDAALNTTTLQIPIYQPGFPVFDSSTYINYVTGYSIPTDKNNDKPFPYTIGHVKRAIALQADTRYNNEIDSAVIAIEKNIYMPNLLDNNSCNYIGFNKTGGAAFASTEEINSLTSNTPLFKTGAGTGPMGFNVQGLSCYDLRFEGFYDFISVEGANYINGLTFSLSTSNNTSSFALSTLEGDSGSMLWALLSSNISTASAWKIVGQVFAYSNEADPILCYASRIDNIQKALKISPWDGNNIAYTPTSPKFFTAYSKADAIQKLGRVCYFVGKTDTLSASYSISSEQIYDVIGYNKK